MQSYRYVGTTLEKFDVNKNEFVFGAKYDAKLISKELLDVLSKNEIVYLKCYTDNERMKEHDKGNKNIYF